MDGLVRGRVRMRSGMDRLGWGVIRSRRAMGFGWLIGMGLTRVLDISHVARVSIGHVVGHSLDSTVRKSNMILSCFSVIRSEMKVY